MTRYSQRNDLQGTKANHVVDGIDIIKVGDKHVDLQDIFNLKEKSYTHTIEVY